MEKIKELWNKFYSNKKLFWGVIGGAAALLVVLGIILAVVLGGGGEVISGCTVTVKTEGGMALEGINVSVYEDADKAEMVTYVTTDANGSATLGEVPAGSVAVLEGVPAGYVVAESYPITQADTQIILKTELLKEMAPITLGGVMFDFTVTDTDGVSYTLSELLKEKDAVVLNLWYTNCGPCKAEFPYLQHAYDKYSDKVALLALDPVADDNEAAVAAFKTGNGLTFPMAKVDAAWADQVEGIAYPTTIVIDRFGTVALIHVGSIDTAGVFEGVFEHFTAEDYVQTTVTDINSLQIEVEAGAGTKENPLEFAGLTEFEVTVEPGQTVYCNLYRVSSMELTVQSETLKVLYGEQEFAPVEGVVTCLINTVDPSTPALVAFTNTGAAAETYKVTMVAPEGSMENPIVLELGDFTVAVTEGNFQGVFYTYTANEKGDFVLTVKKAPKDVKYGIVLNNLTATKYLTLDENGVKDDKGNMTLTVPVNKGDELQLIATVQPDDAGTYPAASIELSAAIKVEEQQGTTGGNDGGSTGGSAGGTDSPVANYDGTLANPDAPVEQFGLNNFSIDVAAGQRMLVNMARVVTDGTLCIYDSSAYVVYDGEIYKPNSSGNVFVSIEAQYSNAVLSLEIGNSGSSDKTYAVKFYFAEGSRENPFDLVLGENTVNAKAGNDQGAFYTYKASGAGTLTLTIKSIDPSTVICGISISDMQTIPTVVELEEGATSVSIELPAGAEAEIVFSTRDPNKEWKIPKATIVIEATFA